MTLQLVTAIWHYIYIYLMCIFSGILARLNNADEDDMKKQNFQYIRFALKQTLECLRHEMLSSIFLIALQVILKFMIM